MELSEYRKRWNAKPVLRAIYHQYYQIILSKCTPGTILEIGGGIGNLKEINANVTSIDIQPAPWLDAVADAQALPYQDCSFDNIVMVDVLHHIENPVKFFREASRVLRSKGKLIMLEPAMTPLSKLFYKSFHDEPVDMGQDPYQERPEDPKRHPFDANQAIPTLIFINTPQTFELMFPVLKLAGLHYVGLFAYPLSGGFKAWNLVPKFALDFILTIEDWVLPAIGKYCAFRMLIVIEKRIQ